MKKLLIGFLLLGILLPAATRTDQFNLSYWLYKPAAATDLTPYWKIDGTSTPNASWNLNAFNLTASNLTASPTLGAELITGATAMSTWTDVADWSYGSSKWTHAATGATALVTNWSPTATVQYKIIVTITHTSGTGVVVSCGGQTYASVAATSTFYLTAIATTALTFTPSTNWIGDITAVSVMVETNGVLTATTGIFTNGLTLNSGQLLFPNGSVAVPPITFGSDPDTGFYSPVLGYLYTTINGTNTIRFGPNGIDTSSRSYGMTFNSETTLRSGGADMLQLGIDAVSPTDQALGAHSASGNDGVGAMLTIQGGRNKGSGAGGGVRIQTANVGASASTAGVEYTRYRAVGKIVTLTDASATDVVSFAVTAGNSVGGMLVYTINVYDNDASDNQVESGTVLFSGLQDEANWHTSISEVSTQALESGTLATTWAIDTVTANTLKITCLADSDLTTPVITLRYQLFLNSPIVETIL